MKTLNRAAPAYRPRKTKNERMARFSQLAILAACIVGAVIGYIT